MKKHTSDTPPLSVPTWETLEGWIRDEIEVRIQSIAEEEVTQFLGRGWYERKGTVDAAPGYRNGYGKLRRLSTSCGTIKIKRVRGLKERFESRILPLFARRTKEVGEVLPELYLHVRPVNFYHPRGGFLERGHALILALLRERVAAGTGQLAVGKCLLAGFGQRHQGKAAQVELTPPSVNR